MGLDFVARSTLSAPVTKTLIAAMMKTFEENIADGDIAGTDIRIMPDLLYLRKVFRNLARTQSVLEQGAEALSESKLLLARIDLPHLKELRHQKHFNEI